MSNPSTPFGFAETGLLDGISPNFGVYTGQIAVNNAHSIFGGDVAAVLAGGYYDYAAEVGGGAQIGGVFLPDFVWQSISFGGTYRGRAWLGNTADVVAGGSIICKVVINSQAKFRVRTNGAGGVIIGQTNIGSNINFARGATPGNNQISTYSADCADMGAGASLPFRITGIVPNPPSDPTSLYDMIEVMFNNLVSP
jgi:hypothetical protein